MNNKEGQIAPKNVGIWVNYSSKTPTIERLNQAHVQWSVLLQQKAVLKLKANLLTKATELTRKGYAMQAYDWRFCKRRNHQEIDIPMLKRRKSGE